MRRACLLLVVLVLSGCAFEEPPAPSSGGAASVAPVATQAPSPVPVGDPCTDLALTLLDGLLNGVPSADPETAVKANAVVEQFVARYDEVIVSSGVAAARAQFSGEVQAACAG